MLLCKHLFLAPPWIGNRRSINLFYSTRSAVKGDLRLLKVTKEIFKDRFNIRSQTVKLPENIKKVTKWKHFSKAVYYRWLLSFSDQNFAYQLFLPFLNIYIWEPKNIKNYKVFLLVVAVHWFYFVVAFCQVNIYLPFKY